MGIRVGINGFGRIGRLVFRVLAGRAAEFDVVAINDLAEAKVLASLLKYDSVHKRFPGEVAADGENLIVNGRRIPCFKERDPKKLPFAKMEVQIAAECT